MTTELRLSSSEPGSVASGRSVYDLLRADVLAGVFPAGSVLQEVVLAERYQVSRTPVRDGLARLEQDGLVERAGRGYRIRAGTAEDVLEIYEARIVLEGQAAAGAAERRTELDLARLRHLAVPVQPGAPPAGGAAAAVDEEAAEQERALHSSWHVAVWTASHNRTVQSLLTRLTAQLRIYDREMYESPADLTLTRLEHARILEAIETRRPEEARAAMTTHLARSRNVRMKRFGTLPEALT